MYPSGVTIRCLPPVTLHDLSLTSKPDNANLDEWRAIDHGEFQNFQLNIFPSLGYTNTPIRGGTTGRPGATR